MYASVFVFVSELLSMYTQPIGHVASKKHDFPYFCLQYVFVLYMLSGRLTLTHVNAHICGEFVYLCRRKNARHVHLPLGLGLIQHYDAHVALLTE